MLRTFMIFRAGLTGCSGQARIGAGQSLSADIAQKGGNCSGRMVGNKCREGVEEAKTSEIHPTTPATFPSNGLLHILVCLLFLAVTLFCMICELKFDF